MKILFFLFAFAIYMMACNESPNEDVDDKIFADYSKCLNEIGVNRVEEVPKTTIKWIYKNGSLSISHLNAGFNCCFNRIEIDIKIDGNKINIKESEIGDKCDCNCPRDIEFQMKSVSKGIYKINITEALSIDNYNPISFEADLANGNNGEISFERPEYPWGLVNK